jgi:hypothetical protein
MCQVPPWVTSARISRPKPGRPISIAVKLSARVRGGGCEAEDGRPADVLAGEVDWANVEVLDEKVQIFGGGLAVVRTYPVVRGTEPT